MRLRLVLPGLLLSSGLLASPPDTPAPGHDRHDRHATLPHDAGLTLSAAIDAALAQATDTSQARARVAEAQSLSARSRSLIAGSPSLQLRYQGDRWQSASGFREQEAGLELPLWRPGQRAALLRESRHASDAATGNEQLRHWLVAGEVREAYWQERLAAWLVERARIDLAAAQRLEKDVLRRIQAGDAAAVERLVAENARREQELALHEAESAHIDSEFAWRILTGLDRLPARGEEPLAETAQNWPPLHQARLQEAREREALTAIQAQAAGAPRLLVSTRREQSQTDTIDSLGATLTIPFGGGSHQQVTLLPVRQQLAQAEDDVRRQTRAAAMATHEARHDLAARREAQEQLAARLALSRKEVELSRRAYQLGETSLGERLLSEQRHAAVERQHGEAELAVQRAIARYNQAQGALP